MTRFALLAGVVAASGLVGSAAGQGALLYDIDFSEPFHTFGDFVTTDTGAAPREGFSGYFITDPADEAVVDGVFDLRAMTDGVASFPNSAQALLELENANGVATEDFDLYTLEFDAVVLNGSSVTVFFDAPTINRFTLGTDFPNDGAGLIAYGGVTSGTDLADFTFGEFLAVRVTYNTVGQNWRIEVDGEMLYQGPVQNTVSTPEWIRFSSSAGVFLDNITVHGSYLECGSADLNDDGILDLSDVTTFIESFNAGCD